MIIAVATESDDLKRFVYYRVERDSIRERECADTPAAGREAVIKQFLGLEIDLLICKSLPAELEDDLREAGVALITGVSGAADAVLKSYLAGNLDF